MNTKVALLLMVASVAVSTGCNRSVTLLLPEPTILTEVLTGTVAPPVGGIPQKVTKNFVVGQGGGEVTVTLTSAVQTLTDGSMQTTVTMGLGVGTVVDSVCIVPSTAFTTTQSGTSPQLAGNLQEGTYCVEVSDVTMQEGPVAFSVTVTHT